MLITYYEPMQNEILTAHLRAPENGFTLLEIMVVLAIIGAMIAAIGINLTPDTDRLARLEAQRFTAVVNEVRDEAIIGGESYFLMIDNSGMNYSFAGIRAERNTSQDDGLLKLRTIEQGVALDWEVFLQFEDELLEKRVLITSLGEITPFDAWFEGDENQYHVFVNDDYQLEQRTERSTRF